MVTPTKETIGSLSKGVTMDQDLVDDEEWGKMLSSRMSQMIYNKKPKVAILLIGWNYKRKKIG